MSAHGLLRVAGVICVLRFRYAPARMSRATSWRVSVNVGSSTSGCRCQELTNSSAYCVSSSGDRQPERMSNANRKTAAIRETRMQYPLLIVERDDFNPKHDAAVWTTQALGEVKHPSLAGAARPPPPRSAPNDRGVSGTLSSGEHRAIVHRSVLYDMVGADLRTIAHVGLMRADAMTLSMVRR